MDGDEVRELLAWQSKAKFGYVSVAALPAKFTGKLAKKIESLIIEFPKLLEDRTEEDVQKALLRDQGRIQEQLKALVKGEGAWKQVS